MSRTESRSIIETQLFINGEARPKVSAVFAKDGVADEAIDNIKLAYSTSIAPGITRDIVFGMLEEVKKEHGHVNMFYLRSVSIGAVTLNYSQGVTNVTVDDAQPTEGKDLTAYLLEPKKEEELDISALGNIDFDAVGARVDQMQAGGGEVVEASNECDGGGCKI